MKTAISVTLLLLVTIATFGANEEKAPAVSVVGYLRDAGCVYRFPEVSKPLPNGCLEACVKAGSPLAILTKDGRVYQPFSETISDTDVRQKILPYAGKLVRVTGHIYERGGSRAISVERIEAVEPQSHRPQ